MSVTASDFFLAMQVNQGKCSTFVQNCTTIPINMCDRFVWLALAGESRHVFMLLFDALCVYWTKVVTGGSESVFSADVIAFDSGSYTSKRAWKTCNIGVLGNLWVSFLL